MRNFGINPSKGGRPPKDKSINAIKIFSLEGEKVRFDISSREYVLLADNKKIKINKWRV